MEGLEIQPLVVRELLVDLGLQLCLCLVRIGGQVVPPTLQQRVNWLLKWRCQHPWGKVSYFNFGKQCSAICAHLHDHPEGGVSQRWQKKPTFLASTTASISLAPPPFYGNENTWGDMVMWTPPLGGAFFPWSFLLNQTEGEERGVRVGMKWKSSHRVFSQKKIIFERPPKCYKDVFKLKKTSLPTNPFSRCWQEARNRILGPKKIIELPNICGAKEEGRTTPSPHFWGGGRGHSSLLEGFWVPINSCPRFDPLQNALVGLRLMGELNFSERKFCKMLGKFHQKIFNKHFRFFSKTSKKKIHGLVLFSAVEPIRFEKFGGVMVMGGRRRRGPPRCGSEGLGCPRHLWGQASF